MPKETCHAEQEHHLRREHAMLAFIRLWLTARERSADSFFACARMTSSFPRRTTGPSPGFCGEAGGDGGAVIVTFRERDGFLEFDGAGANAFQDVHAAPRKEKHAGHGRRWINKSGVLRFPVRKIPGAKGMTRLLPTSAYKQAKSSIPRI
jgi:hypothetical protein